MWRGSRSRPAVDVHKGHEGHDSYIVTKSQAGAAAFLDILLGPFHEIFGKGLAESPLAASLNVIGTLGAEEAVAVGLPEKIDLLLSKEIPVGLFIIKALIATSEIVEINLKLHGIVSEILHIIPVLE